MARGRHGIWKCPECKHHQTWKTRSRDSTKLDRRCAKCGERARVTIERSESGKGRTRKVEIWERSLSLRPEDLEKEADRRNLDSGIRIYGMNWAVLIMALTTYPYVFLLSTESFSMVVPPT